MLENGKYAAWFKIASKIARSSTAASIKGFAHWASNADFPA
jgi:hypothetical protein